jgi:RNA polymerase sigma-70 factor (ECF subfamily)
MRTDDDTFTSVTLLLRLRDLSDKQAWEDFVERYVPKIYGWCRRNRLQEADAADVTQEVLGKLVSAMRKFDYNPDRGSFRGWLKTVTNNAVRDFASSYKKHGRGSGDSQVNAALASIADPSALAELAGEIEAEAEREMLREAEARVKVRVQKQTWDAYELTAVRDIAAPDVAARLNMPVGQVYVAKSRIIKLLRQEVRKLDGAQDNHA